MVRSMPSSRSGSGGRSASAASPRSGCRARSTCCSGSWASGLARSAWAARSSALAMAAPSRATNARAPASRPSASAARICADGRPASWSSSWPSASAFAVSASVHAPARRTKIFKSSTARTASCLVWASQLRRPSCTARASDSRPAAARAIACWFAISALPRSARASRTSSSALGCSLWASSPSRRSRYSPASSAKKSDMPSGLLGSVMELQHKPSAFGRQRRRLVHELSHAPHLLFHPPEHRVTHDRVPDVQLFDLGDRGDRLYVLVGEPVTRVHGEAARLGVRGGTPQHTQCRVALPPGVRVPAGVQLDRGHAELGGAVDRRQVRVDEQAHADAGVRKAPHGRPDLTVGAPQPEAAFGRDLPAPLRDERRLKRLHATRDAHDLVVGAELEVEHAAHRRLEGAHVGVLDVPSVFAQVY